jgi:hypothetical protein
MRPLVCTLLIAACQTPVVTEPPAIESAPPVSRPDPWDVTPRDRPPAQPPVPVEVPARIAMPPGANEPIAEPTPSRLIAAMPSAPIAMLALTDDGRAAVTADFSRSGRVWPTLDGKREPIVVSLRAPALLALTRDGSRLVIGALDAAGQLEIVVTRSTGESERRLAIEAARPFVALHAVPGGFLALDDERAVYAIGIDGTVSPPLVADPEQHVAALAIRGARALAMIESGGSVHGRWIDLARQPRWGAPTPTLPITSERVAISPDGKRIAGVTKSGKRLIIVDLESGRQVGRATDLDFVDPRLRPVGWVDDKTLAFSDQSQGIQWWNGKAHEPSSFSDNLIAAGDGVVIGTIGTALEITAFEKATHFLGYRMGGPQLLHPVGERFLASDMMGLVELDEHFRTREVHELTKPEGTAHTWSNVRILDDRHVLASTYIGNSYAIYMIDLDANEAKLVTKNGYPIDYQVSSGLLAYRSGNTFNLVKLDVKAGIAGKPVTIPIDPTVSTQLVLLDPVRANGSLAAIVTAAATSATVKVIGALHPDRTHTSYEIVSDRSVELTARWWENVGDFTKLVDRSLVPSTRIKSPDGKHAAEVMGARIRLTDDRGRTVWTAPAHAATSVVWTASGRLVAFGTGMAEVDLMTGALLERQCGWRFGKWSTVPGGFGSAQLCEAP